MKRSFLMPVEGLSLDIDADIILVRSAPSWTILLFPSKLWTGESNEVPWSLNNFDSQRRARKLNRGITLYSVISERIAEPSSHDLNEGLQVRLPRCDRGPTTKIRVVLALIVDLITLKTSHQATIGTECYAAREVRSRHRSAPLSTCSIVKPASTVRSLELKIPLKHVWIVEMMRRLDKRHLLIWKNPTVSFKKLLVGT